MFYRASSAVSCARCSVLCATYAATVSLLYVLHKSFGCETNSTVVILLERKALHMLSYKKANSSDMIAGQIQVATSVT